ncbi:hypothetical protein [Methanothermococcus sp.]|nr:hypothetical protein [Methanothermococcus sp.]
MNIFTGKLPFGMIYEFMLFINEVDELQNYELILLNLQYHLNVRKVHI